VSAPGSHADEISSWRHSRLRLALLPSLAALNTRFSGATPLPVVLGSTRAHHHRMRPLASALERVMEVAVGGIIGLLVSILVLPARAYNLVSRRAQILEVMAGFCQLVCEVHAARR